MKLRVFLVVSLCGYTLKIDPCIFAAALHFMDKKEVGNEMSEELTRESLIAISFSVPDNYHSPSLLPNKPSSDFVGEGINGDGAENYRSKLISISNKQSPDIKAQPVSPGEHKA